MSTIVFYEVGPDCPSTLPVYELAGKQHNLTEHERQLFDAINNAGAIDLKLLAKRSYGGQLLLNQSLGKLQSIGAISRRTVETEAIHAWEASDYLDKKVYEKPTPEERETAGPPPWL